MGRGPPPPETAAAAAAAAVIRLLYGTNSNPNKPPNKHAKKKCMLSPSSPPPTPRLREVGKQPTPWPIPKPPLPPPTITPSATVTCLHSLISAMARVRQHRQLPSEETLRHCSPSQSETSPRAGISWRARRLVFSLLGRPGWFR